MTAKQIIDGILRREGGYVNNPADMGGPTKFGITLKTLRAWRKARYSGLQTTTKDVQALEKDEARKIYHSQYYEKPKISLIENARLRIFLLDSAVQHSPRRVVRWLQKVVAVPVDGLLGPVSLEAINRLDSDAIYVMLVAERCRFYGRLITRKPSQAVFAAGWANRIAEFIEEIDA